SPCLLKVFRWESRELLVTMGAVSYEKTNNRTHQAGAGAREAILRKQWQEVSIKEFRPWRHRRTRVGGQATCERGAANGRLLARRVTGYALCSRSLGVAVNLPGHGCRRKR